MNPTHSKNWLGRGGEDKHPLATPTADVQEVSVQKTLAAELNLAKFASFLFAPSHTRPNGKPDDRARAKTWTLVNKASGQKTLAKIVVNTVNGRSLNTLDHRTWLALQKLWWERPKDPDGSTTLGLKDVARTMGLSWGNKVCEALKASLWRLRWVPITWQYSFVHPATGEIVSTQDGLTILEKFRITERHRAARPEDISDKTVKPETARGFFRFHELIAANLARRYTKPILFEVAMGIRGEIALGLYSFLDVVMADKVAWERRVTELLRDDLTVSGKYSRPAERRRLLLRAIQELQGKPISTGRLQLAIVKTADDQDYKLVVRKQTFAPRLRPPRVNPRADYLVEEILRVTGDAHSRPYYAKLAHELPEQTIWALLSETRQADLEGRVTTSKARYFTDLAERHLGHKPQGFSS